MTPQKTITDIGSICNHYGGLVVKAESGKHFWAIEDCKDGGWEEIPESLYRALIEFETSRKRNS